MQAPTKPPAVKPPKVATCKGAKGCEGEIWGYEMCWDHWDEMWKIARMQ